MNEVQGQRGMSKATNTVDVRYYERNRQTWWGQDAKRILDYIEEHRGNMSDFEVLEDIMCGSYVDWFEGEEE